MAKIHDLFIIELAEVIKGYGNDSDVEDPFRLSEFYRFYELPNIAVSRENFEKMRPAQPDIIRCKDCKHQVKEWRADKRLKDKGYMVCGCEVVGDACGYWALLGQDDDYCSYAERRTDE